MAGISIELKKLIKDRSISKLFLALGYSTALSSGNWILAVGVIFVFSLLGAAIFGRGERSIIYQVYITYTVALSLIISGPLQLMFTRYVADRIFEKEEERILPNFIGSVVLAAISGFAVALALSFYLFKGLAYYYHLVFAFTVATLSAVWVSNSLLAGLKKYWYIFVAFTLSYFLAGVLFLITFKQPLVVSFFGFYISQFILLLLLLYRVLLDYPSYKVLEFDFLNPRRSYYSLALTGFFYNLGVWVDKFVFWFSPMTGDPLFANIRTSVVYDIPIILSYMSIIPGLAVFFLKTEAEFAERYDEYYDAVRNFGSLQQLYFFANKMILSVRDAFYDTLRIQLVADVGIYFFELPIFYLLKLPPLYIPLFNILLVGATLQLLFMVLFTLFSYYDRKKTLAILTGLFALLNAILSALSQYLGPYYYGYGYTVSLLIVVILGMIILSRFLNEIHYRTFMIKE
jgi:uncharacterized membrane protein